MFAGTRRVVKVVVYFNRLRYNLEVEKRTPHYALARVKELIELGSYHVTRTALRSARHDFDLSKAEYLLAVVLQLERVDFYKSMTTYSDARIWQDVYRPALHDATAYVKVQIVADKTVIISFKKLEDN